MPEFGKNKPQSIEQAMEPTTPTIATVKKYHGEDAVIRAVGEVISFYGSLSNVGKQLQPHQIEYLADEIVRDFYFLTFGEIQYVMRRGIRKEYGEIYDCIDVSTVLSWVDKYDAERTAYAEQRAKKAHLEVKAVPVAQLGATTKGPIEAPAYITELAERLAAPYTEITFEPDEFFEQMIQNEYDEKNTQTTFDNYRAMRIVQVKASLKK